MKVRILHRFHDKADYNTVYLVGDSVTFDDSRAEYLISLGLVEEIKKVEDDKVLIVEEKVTKPVTARRRSSQKDNQ